MMTKSEIKKVKYPIAFKLIIIISMWYQFFDNGRQGNTIKTNVSNVRAVRAFGSTPEPPSLVIDTHSMVITDNGTVTLTVTTSGTATLATTDPYVAVIKIGDTPVTGGTWTGNEYTRTSPAITSTTSAALTYSVTVTDNFGNKSVASTGVAKGEGEGWAYYAVVAQGATLDVTDGHNVAIDGWYEISDELAIRYAWLDGVSYPAKAAAAVYKGGNKIDWKLPSKAELNAAYLALYAKDAPLDHDAPSLKNLLWSSSEYYSNYAWYQSFTNGSQTNTIKTYDIYVRAIRAF